MKKFLLIALICVSFFLFFYKLDYEAFFTDEILYYSAGREYILEKDYTLNLQHPLIAKYMAGFASIVTERSAFVLRFPFALMGAFFPLIVYSIIRKEYGDKWGIFGGAITLTFPFLYSTARMTMMEAPMHFFWLLFHLSFLNFLRSKSKKDVIWSGIFLGLSVASKFTSFILVPFSFVAVFLYILLKKQKVSDYKHYFALLVIGGITTLLSYFDFVLKRGMFDLIAIPRAIKDVLIERNADGKEQSLNNQVFFKSPAWFYPYYVVQKYPPVQIVISFFSSIAVLYNQSFFAIYWWLFFIMTTLMMQLITLKNARYIGSIELPLIFLTVVFIKYIYDWAGRIKIKNIVRGLLAFSIIFVFAFQSYKMLTQQMTGERALYDYMVKATNNFTTNDRLLIYSSIRSSKWQFDDAPEDKVTVLRGADDAEKRFETFPTYNYFAVRDNEALTSNNELIRFLFFNRPEYDVIKISNLNLYIQKENANVQLLK